MAYVLNEDQQLLKTTAADFIKKECPVSRLRSLRDSGNAGGFDRAMWSRMAELGWPAILVPERHGGLEMGMTELCCVLEEFGKNLVPEPLFTSALLGAGTLLAAADEPHCAALLPEIATGSSLVTLAYHERGSRYDFLRTTTRARKHGLGWIIDGEKSLVFDGYVADKFIVSARTDGGVADRDGITLFVIDAGAAGLTVTKQSTMHLRDHALVLLAGVEVNGAAVLGSEGCGGEILEDVLDRASVGLSAEMLGNAEGAFEMTLEYLKTRKQFGVLIGTFQALKHRAAELFTEIELSRSAVLGACHALDHGLPEARSLVSVAKARCSDTAVLAGYEGIQMHGGIGMTDEHEIGFYAKRAKASELTFGDAAYHRDRFARLAGF